MYLLGRGKDNGSVTKGLKLLFQGLLELDLQTNAGIYLTYWVRLGGTDYKEIEGNFFTNEEEHSEIWSLVLHWRDWEEWDMEKDAAFFIEVVSLPMDATQEEEFDYSERSQWLRAAVLGANDGLVSIASLMMGIGAVKKDVKAMILTGFAGLVAGACSMAIGEFVSVYSQLEIEVAQIKRETGKDTEKTAEENNNEDLPNPLKAALASGLAFTLGATVPILAAAFIGDHKVRLAAVIAAVSLALAVFGGTGAVLGGAPVMVSCARVLVGGWMAMAITFGLTKGISSGVLDM